MKMENELCCPRCGSTKLVKDGNYNGFQGYRCKNCKKKFSAGKYDCEYNIQKLKKKQLVLKFRINDYKSKLDYRENSQCYC